MSALFPRLGTNAIAQYPATRSIHSRGEVLWFVDGSKQRYREGAGPFHQWAICLDQLDEGEMAVLEQFFTDNQGRLGSFSFTDPHDGLVYPNCSFTGDDLELTMLAELKGRAVFTVKENQG